MSNDDIRAALEAATPGPWGVEWQECDNWFSIYGAPTGEYVCPEVATVESGGDSEALLISNAPTWLAELLAENERLREACTDFENAYVGEHGDRLAAEQAIGRIRAYADYLDTLAGGDRHYAAGIREALDGQP